MGCGSSSPQHQSRKVVPHDGDDNGGTTTTAKSKVAWDTDGQKDGLKVAPSAAADTSPAASTSAAATTTTPQQKNEEERGGSSSANSWLRDVLSRAGLESFADALGNDVGVKDKEDLKDVVQADLVDIGMSSEEQEAFLKLVAAVEKKADVEPPPPPPAAAAAANEETPAAEEKKEDVELAAAAPNEEEDKPTPQQKNEEERGGSSSANSWLRDVLSRAGLESFADALGNDVGVKDKEDLKDVVQADLVDIGMSSEEQEAFLKLVAAVEKKADVEPAAAAAAPAAAANEETPAAEEKKEDVEPAAAANEEEEDKPSAEKEEEEEKEEAPPPPPPSPAAVEEVAPGGGGCMSCVTVADGTNPDGTRKDPQTCWDRTRDKARLMASVKSMDEQNLEKVLRRMHTEKASLTREGSNVLSDKRKLNVGNTALCQAVVAKWLPGVKLLVNYKVGINTPNMRGATPLFLASFHGFDDAVEVLLEGGARTDVMAWPGADMSKTKDKRESEFLSLDSTDASPISPEKKHLKSAATFRKGSGVHGIAALHVAVKRGHASTTKLLCVHGADVALEDFEGRNALHYAARELRLDIIDALAAADDNEGSVKQAINATTEVGRTPLEIALETMDDASPSAEEIAALGKLLALGANANGRLTTMSSFPDHGPLHFAIQRGTSSWASVVQLLVGEGNADANALDPKGNPPIVRVACLGPGVAMEMAEALLPSSSKLDADARDSSGKTAMQSAVQDWPQASEEEIASFAGFLVKSAGARINIEFGGGISAQPTALMVAVERGMHSHLIPVLLANGAEVNLRDASGATAALYAARYGIGGATQEGKALEVLRSLGSPDMSLTSDAGESPLETCLGLWRDGGESGSKFVDIAISLGADVNSGSQFVGETPLLIAARKSKVEESKTLIRHGADVNTAHQPTGRTAAHVAAIAGNANLLNVLIEAGASPHVQSSSGETVLLVAVSAGSEACARVLLDAGVDIDSCESTDGISPLLAASANGDVMLMHLLMSHGANLDRTLIATKRNALHLVVISGNPRASAMLCALAIDQGPAASDGWVNAADISGCTPLSYAVDAAHVGDSRRSKEARATCSFLLDAGADPNVLDSDGVPLLVSAARNNAAALATVLVTRARRPLKHLHEALVDFTKFGNVGMCESLLLAGADPNGAPLVAVLDAAVGNPQSALRIAGLLVRFGGRVDRDVINARTSEDASLLDIAALLDDANCVHMLVAAGFGNAPEIIAEALLQCAIYKSAAAASALLSYPGCEDALETMPLISCLYDEYLQEDSKGVNQEKRGIFDELGNAADKVVDKMNDRMTKLLRSMSGKKDEEDEEDEERREMRLERLKLGMLFLAEGANGDVDSAIAYSVDAKDHVLLSMLIMSGCSVYDEPGLLMRAVKKCDHVAVGILLSAGIPITDEDVACSIDLVRNSTANAPCATLLLQAGGSSNARDAKGDSLLKSAYRGGSIDFRDPASMRILEHVESVPIYGFRNHNFLSPAISDIEVLGETRGIEHAFDKHASLCQEFFDKRIEEHCKEFLKKEIKEKAKEMVKEEISVAGKEVSLGASDYWEARMGALEEQPQDLSECAIFDMDAIESNFFENQMSSPALSDSGISSFSADLSTLSTDLINNSSVYHLKSTSDALVAAAGPMAKVFSNICLEAGVQAAKTAVMFIGRIGAMMVSGGMSELLGGLGAIVAFAEFAQTIMAGLQIAGDLMNVYKQYENFIKYGKEAVKMGKMILQAKRWPADLLALRLLIYSGADMSDCKDAVAAMAIATSKDAKDPTMDAPIQNAWEWAGLVDEHALSFPSDFKNYREQGYEINQKYDDALRKLTEKFEDLLNDAENRKEERKYRKAFDKMKKELEDKRATELSTAQYKSRVETLMDAFKERTNSMRRAEQWWQRERARAGVVVLQSRQQRRDARASDRARLRSEKLSNAVAFLDGITTTYRALLPTGKPVAPQSSTPPVIDLDLDLGSTRMLSSTCEPLLRTWPNLRGEEGMKKVVEVETSTTAVIASTEESSIDFDTVKVTNDEPVKNVTPPPQQETTTAAAPAYETEEEEGGGDSSAISWLRDVLSPAGLESFANALVNTIGVEDKEDLKDVVRADLESIGMSSEEQEAFQKLIIGTAAAAPALEEEDGAPEEDPPAQPAPDALREKEEEEQLAVELDDLPQKTLMQFQMPVMLPQGTVAGTMMRFVVPNEMPGAGTELCFAVPQGAFAGQVLQVPYQYDE